MRLVVGALKKTSGNRKGTMQKGWPANVHPPLTLFYLGLLQTAKPAMPHFFPKSTRRISDLRVRKHSIGIWPANALVSCRGTTVPVVEFGRCDRRHGVRPSTFRTLNPAHIGSRKTRRPSGIKPSATNDSQSWHISGRLHLLALAQ
jgi:hypothetical protein